MATKVVLGEDLTKSREEEAIRPANMDQRDQDQSDQEERDEEKERIHRGHEDVEPEPGVTAGLDQFTDEEKRQEPAGVMPGAGPDEEPGPDRGRRRDDGDKKDRGDE